MSEKYEIKKDIIVNSQQKIMETIRIMEEAGLFPNLSDGEYQIRSLRTRLSLELNRNYEQNHIFYGDILEII
jgi:hypothetical protein